MEGEGRLVAAARAGVLALFGLVIGCLALASLPITYVLPIWTDAVLDVPQVARASLPVLVLVLAGLWLGRPLLARANPRALAVVLLAWVAAVTYAWSFRLADVPPRTDQLWVSQAAEGLIDGTLAGDADRLWYFRMYPHQWGYVYYLVALYRLFGVANYAAVRVVQAVLVAGGLLAACAMAPELVGAFAERAAGEGAKRPDAEAAPGADACADVDVAADVGARARLAHNVALVLGMTAVPFVMHANLVYGNAPAEGLWLIGLYCQLRALRPRSDLTSFARWAAACLACLFGALWLKPNSLLALLAVEGVWLLAYLGGAGHGWRGNGLAVLGAFLAGALVYLAAHHAPAAMARAECGASADHALPAEAFVAMGLQESNRGAGMYNGFTSRTYRAARGDERLARERARENLDARLASFADDPALAADFFGRKVAGTWLEPTYGTLWMSLTTADERYGIGMDDPRVQGRGLDAFFVACDAAQSLLYLGALALVLRRRPRGWPPRTLGPALAFLACLAFHLLWETRSIYVLGYATALLPYAAVGLAEACRRALPEAGGEMG